MTNIKKRYYRAVAIAEFIAEGHTIAETMKEIGVCKETIRKDLIFLADYGYGKENEKNMLLYQKAKNALSRKK